MKLEDRVVLVTGGARRVGRVVALAFARRGARVVVHCRTSCEEAESTARECTEASEGREAFSVQADQAAPGAVERAVEETERRAGRIDVLINSASAFHSTPFLASNVEDWRAMMETNFFGPARFCRGVAPGMLRRGEGAIVNVADVAAERPWPRFGAYCASKAALINLTKTLALELAPAVRVNAVAPGSVLLPEDANEDLERRSRAVTALERIGRPEDVAAACLFLVEGTGFATGSVVTVDGGRNVRGPLEQEA